MTLLPRNARSEFVLPMNCPCGCVLDPRRMFHAASPALKRPAFSPTRGSGLGAAYDTAAPIGAATGERLPAVVEVVRAQAPTATKASVSASALLDLVVKWGV